jgi:hypothetical protein
MGGAAEFLPRGRRGLGQGLGTALGIKLGATKRPGSALIGDGSLIYNPVVQALGASKGNDLPILIVVCNQRARAAPLAKKLSVAQSSHHPRAVSSLIDRGVTS